MNRDRLVATPSADANAYLASGLAAVRAELAAEDARAAWLRAEDRKNELDGWRGSAEAAQRAARAYDEQRHALTAVQHTARRARAAALTGDPRATAAVDAELAAARADRRPRSRS
ncbi:hypothetical protein ACFOWE_17970 [Planomonospora corallina]|uniref:Uncharacterized protein n=1 Tax=Planomonospora corallina TaxID=1806052 RepID=A0ABV8IED3_9ACTN